MYTSQSFNTHNKVDLLLIDLTKKPGFTQMTPASWTCTPYNPSIHQIYKTYYLLLTVSEIWKSFDFDFWCFNATLKHRIIIREKLTLRKIFSFFQVVTEPWKWGRGQWTYDRRKLRNISLLYTNYEASSSSTL